ncbi:MAG: hypothetical protein HPY73_01635 [Methanomassiliicoccales archaeon]|nr:MAG: hypothetical protein HPY73_01635 [Methanomassiliicoccales archaeon]
MGVGVSAASAIMFTTFILIFSTVFVAVDDLQDTMIETQMEHYEDERYLDRLSISIVSVDVIGRRVDMINDGGVCIDVRDVDVLLNGVYLNDLELTIDVQGVINSTIWGPGEIATISFKQDIDGARIKVSVLGQTPAYYVP